MCKVRRRHCYDETFTVYGIRVNNNGDNLFFIYEDGYWFWEFASEFVPVD